jgi:hypothetical protein
MQSPSKGRADNDTGSLSKDIHAPSQRFGSIRRKANRLRPKSWLSFARAAQETQWPRSVSTQLPKAASSSTIARSVISAPILTSTTNPSVARNEGVRYDAISDANLSDPYWNMHRHETATGNPNDSATAHTPQSSANVLSSDTEDQAGRSFSGILSKKRRITRLKAVFKDKFRPRSSFPNTTVQSEQANDGSQETEQGGDNLLGRRLTRRHHRAETIDHYKGKIQELTGNGHIRRKSVNNSKGVAESKEDEGPPLLGDLVDAPAADLAADHSDHESPFGSLTKSFASAVDKLDFYSNLPRNMSFLRSKSSLPNAKKSENNSDGPRGAEPGFPPISPTSPAQPFAQAVTAPAQPNSQVSQLEANSSVRPSLSAPSGSPPMSRQSLRSAQAELARRQSGPASMVFSNEKNGYVASAPVPGYPHGVNPLRMHPPTTMAIPPAEIGLSSSFKPAECPTPSMPPPPNPTTPGPDGDSDSDSTSLEDAPIYSPSLGDLSQYARGATPRSVNFTVARTSQASAPVPTPTRSPIKSRISAKGQFAGLKKSRSGISLFSRARRDAVAAHAGVNALTERDTNRMISNDGEKMVRKSKSLHFGLFKKAEQQDRIPSVPPSPFQPATPSPLRKVTRYDSQSTNAGSSPTTLSGKK